MINTLKAPAIAGLTTVIALSTFLFAHEGHDHSQALPSNTQLATQDRKPDSVINQAPPLQTVPQSSAPLGTLPPGHSPNDEHDHSNHNHDRSGSPDQLRPMTNPGGIYPPSNNPYFESPRSLPGNNFGVEPYDQTQFNAPPQFQNEFDQGCNGHNHGCPLFNEPSSRRFTCQQSRGTCPQTYQQHSHYHVNEYESHYDHNHLGELSSYNCRGNHPCPFNR